MKYDSGTGWPSFFDYYKSIETKIDYKLIYPRVSIVVLCVKDITDMYLMMDQNLLLKDTVTMEKY